jgi:hypothetical protein
MASAKSQEFSGRTNSMLTSNPSYRNLDAAPGQQSEMFTVTNADGAGIYRISFAWHGAGAVNLYTSSGSVAVAGQNGGDTQIALAAGTYYFAIGSGSPTAVAAAIERIN